MTVGDLKRALAPIDDDAVVLVEDLGDYRSPNYVDIGLALCTDRPRSFFEFWSNSEREHAASGCQPAVMLLRT